MTSCLHRMLERSKSSIELTTEEAAVKRDDDYKDLNSENEEYYDEIASGKQNVNVLPKSIAEKRKTALLPNKHMPNAKEETQSDSRLDENVNEIEGNNIHSASDEEENTVFPKTEHVDEVYSKLRPDMVSSHKLKNSGAFKIRKGNDKLKEYLRIARHNSRKRQAVYKSKP